MTTSKLQKGGTQGKAGSKRALAPEAAVGLTVERIKAIFDSAEADAVVKEVLEKKIATLHEESANCAMENDPELLALAFEWGAAGYKNPRAGEHSRLLSAFDHREERRTAAGESVERREPLCVIVSIRSTDVASDDGWRQTATSNFPPEQVECERLSRFSSDFDGKIRRDSTPRKCAQGRAVPKKLSNRERAAGTKELLLAVGPDTGELHRPRAHGTRSLLRLSGKERSRCLPATLTKLVNAAGVHSTD